MVDFLHSKNLKSIGIEGDSKAIEKSKNKHLIKNMDFTKDKYISDIKYDLGYSVEFLEHVDEKYIENYINAFKNCKYIVITAAPPKWPGHHHVNCKEHKYWLKLFNKHNFYLDSYITKICREKSTMNIERGNNKTFFKHRALFFINADLIDIDKYNICKELPEKITENTLILHKNYYDLHVPENDTNKVTNTNGHLFKSTVPLVSYLI